MSDCSERTRYNVLALIAAGHGGMSPDDMAITLHYSPRQIMRALAYLKAQKLISDEICPHCGRSGYRRVNRTRAYEEGLNVAK